jgi:hypothetical protein
MLINLSSQNEADPARFHNDFFDSIVIKKNSFICLVKAQIIRTKEQKQVSIPPDTVMYVRWTAYDISQLILNPAGTENLILTMTGLVNYINSRWATMGFPAGYVLEALVEDAVGDGNDEKIELKFIATVFEEGVVDFRWKEEVYADHGGNNYFTVKYGQCYDSNNALIAFPPGTAVPEDDIQYFFSQAATWACGAIWDAVTRTPNDNQLNKNAFNLLTTEILSPTRLNGYTPMNYYINQPNSKINISFGVSTTNDNAIPEYLTGPYVGNNNFDPQETTKSNILSLEYEGAQGTLQAKVFNDELGQFEINSVDYRPGDYFEVYSLVDHEGAIDLIDPQRAFYMNVNHYKSSGLVLAYQGNLGSINDRPGNGNYFLSSNTVQPDTKDSMNNMSYAFDGDHLRDNYYKKDSTNLEEFLIQWHNDFEGWQSNAVIGGRVKIGRDGQTFTGGIGSGWVYNQSLGRPHTKQFLLAYEDGQSDLAQWRYAPAAQGFSNLDGVIRANGSTIEIPSTYLLTTLPFSCEAPTLLCASFMFNKLAETMIPANLDANIRTVIGGNNNRVLQLFLNQSNAAGFDYELTLSSGAAVNGTLLDAGGNRINIRSSDNNDGYTYNTCLRYFGDVIKSFRLEISECYKAVGAPAVHTLYTTVTTTIAGPIASYNSIGGINPLEDVTLTNYNDYSPLTYISNIRIFQSNLRADNTQGWGEEILAVQGAMSIAPSYAEVNRWFTQRPGAFPPLIDFYPNATNEFIVPTVQQGTQDPYNNVGFPNSAQNVGVFLSKPDSVAPLDLTSPIINNLFIPACQIMRDSRRVKTLPTDAYADIGQGLVETDTPVGKGIADVLDFINPDPDPAGNLIQIPRVLAPNPTAPDDWTSKITADADVSLVDNEAMNVEITNLTHRTLNGANKSYDKTIYQIPTIAFTSEIGNQEIVEFSPPSKVWIPLDNAMEIPLNKLDVLIATVDGKKVETLSQETNISIQIEDNVALLN